MSFLTRAYPVASTHLNIAECILEISHRDSIPEPPDHHLGEPLSLAVDVDPAV